MDMMEQYIRVFHLTLIYQCYIVLCASFQVAILRLHSVKCKYFHFNSRTPGLNMYKLITLLKQDADDVRVACQLGSEEALRQYQ